LTDEAIIMVISSHLASSFIYLFTSDLGCQNSTRTQSAATDNEAERHIAGIFFLLIDDIRVTLVQTANDYRPPEVQSSTCLHKLRVR